MFSQGLRLLRSAVCRKWARIQTCYVREQDEVLATSDLLTAQIAFLHYAPDGAGRRILAGALKVDEISIGTLPRRASQLGRRARAVLVILVAHLWFAFEAALRGHCRSRR